MNSPVQAPIQPNVNPLVDYKEMSFRFNKDDTGFQRPKVEFSKVPVPSADGIAQILMDGGKPLDLLLEVCAAQIRSTLKTYVEDDPQISEATFDFGKVSWQAIANMERAERKSIDPELWKSFADDYIKAMSTISDKTAQQLSNQVTIYLKKLVPLKTNKPMLNALQPMLAMYAGTPNAEKYSDILELLNRRFEAYLATNDMEDVVNNLV